MSLSHDEAIALAKKLFEGASAAYYRLSWSRDGKGAQDTLASLIKEVTHEHGTMKTWRRKATRTTATKAKD